MSFSVDFIVSIIKGGLFIFVILVVIGVILWILYSFGLFKWLGFIIKAKPKGGDDKRLEELKKHPDWKNYKDYYSKGNNQQPEGKNEKWVREAMGKGYKRKDIRNILTQSNFPPDRIQEMVLIYNKLKAQKKKEIIERRLEKNAKETNLPKI